MIDGRLAAELIVSITISVIWAHFLNVLDWSWRWSKFMGALVFIAWWVGHFLTRMP